MTVADKNIYEVTNMPVQKLQGFFRDLKLSKQQELIGRQILKEIRAGLDFWQRLAWSIFHLEELPEPFPAEKLRGSVLPHRSDPGLWGLHISWMSRVSGFTREIMTSFWGH